MELSVILIIIAVLGIVIAFIVINKKAPYLTGASKNDIIAVNNIEQIYLERLISIKRDVSEINNYSAYKNLKIILTGYLKEKYRVRVKTTMDVREQAALTKNGCKSYEVDMLNMFFKKLSQIKDIKDSDDKKLIYELYDSVTDYFSERFPNYCVINEKTQEVDSKGR